MKDFKSKYLEFTKELLTFGELLNGVDRGFIRKPNGAWIQLFEYIKIN